MILNGIVVNGVTLTPNSNGDYTITPAILQALGNPAVSISLPQDALVYPVITVGAESSNVVLVGVQLKDANNIDLESKFLAECWLSDAEGGVPSVTAFSGAGLAVVTGTLIQSIVASRHFKVLSSAFGTINLSFTETGARTLYFNLVVGGLYYKGDISLVWTA